jgi:hypothetical protein
MRLARDNLATTEDSSNQEVAMLWTTLPAHIGVPLDQPWHHAVQQRAVERRARNAARGALGTLWRRVHVASGEHVKEAVLVTDGH